MATVESVIDSARYDLVDYQEGIMWDNRELLDYFNRMVEVMQSYLAKLNSELVEEEEADIDCVLDQNYVDLSNMNNGLWSSIRQVWIGQDLIEQTSVGAMRYKRIYRSGSQKPYYWALRNQQLMFENDSDQAYDSLLIYYNAKQPTLALTDNMPYQDRFNDSFVEMLNLYAQSKKDGSISQINGVMRTVFEKRAMEEVISRDFIKKHYYIDF